MQLPLNIAGDLREDAKANTQGLILLALNGTACELGQCPFYLGISRASAPSSGTNLTVPSLTVPYGDIFYKQSKQSFGPCPTHKA